MQRPTLSRRFRVLQIFSCWKGDILFFRGAFVEVGSAPFLLIINFHRRNLIILSLFIRSRPIFLFHVCFLFFKEFGDLLWLIRLLSFWRNSFYFYEFIWLLFIQLCKKLLRLTIVIILGLKSVVPLTRIQNSIIQLRKHLLICIHNQLFLLHWLHGLPFMHLEIGVFAGFVPLLNKINNFIISLNMPNIRIRMLLHNSISEKFPALAAEGLVLTNHLQRILLLLIIRQLIYFR